MHLDFLNQFSGTALTLAGALAVAVLAYAILSTLFNELHRRKIAGGFQAFTQPETVRDTARVGSQAYKIRTALAAYGLEATGQEETMYSLVWGISGAAVFLGLTLLQINFLLAVLAGAGDKFL